MDSATLHKPEIFARRAACGSRVAGSLRPCGGPGADAAARSCDTIDPRASLSVMNLYILTAPLSPLSLSVFPLLVIFPLVILSLRAVAVLVLVGAALEVVLYGLDPLLHLLLVRGLQGGKKGAGTRDTDVCEL